MPEVIIIGERDLRRAVQLNREAVGIIESGFRALADGAVEMPPVLSMALHDRNGEVDVKAAYVRGFESFAIKVSPGFFDNPKIGLPSTSGLMLLFSARTGQIEAVFLDNGYLTDVRTAAAGAVAAKHLSRGDSTRATIIGAGVQARMQLQALRLVRPITEAVIWARDLARAQALADEMTAAGLASRAEGDIARAARGADIIVTTTPAQTPLITAEMLSPGQHLTAMGSDQDNKTEIAPNVFGIARYVPDRLSQTRLMGELRGAIAAGVVAADREFDELGAVIAGQARGRTGADEITFADLTGTGVQDTAIANFARSRMTSGMGARIHN